MLLLLGLFGCAPTSGDKDTEPRVDDTAGATGSGGGSGVVDADGDGYGSSTDCDDTSTLIHPGADELCDGLDDDCDGDIDEDPVDGDTWYADTDLDGYGGTAVVACDAPSGSVATGGDCDDTDAAAHPGATELCDGVDDDCDGATDEDAADATTWYLDDDGDGYGASSLVACDAPVGYAAAGGDCDDADATVNPSAVEDCSVDVDADCDGIVSWADTDGDGYAACVDCDDTRADVHPDAVEVCDADHTDEDCSGAADDDDPGVTGAVAWYGDGDGDGYGDGGVALVACDAPSGYAALDGDCDETDATIHPGAEESCDAPVDANCDGSVSYADADGDGWAACEDCDDTRADVNPDGMEVCDAGSVDEDCDGAVNEADADVLGLGTWYADGDGDGYGDAASPEVACAEPSRATTDATDCDDAAAAVHPGATEVCDALDVDEDCDGTIDDADPSVSGEATWYLDLDGDGHGDPSVSYTGCDAPSGYVASADDCDDDAAGVHPGATEVCDGANTDEDCDGAADDADSGVSGRSTWYTDTDADGYGAGAGVAYCDPPSGMVATSGDCVDTNAAANPGAAEVCDGLDNDCDGALDDADTSLTGSVTWYRDVDGDGYGGTTTRLACSAPSGYAATGGDCNDASATISPAGTEVCDAGTTDEDCDGTFNDGDSSVIGTSTFYADTDGDGYGNASSTLARCVAPSGYVADATDCDDTTSARSPAAAESCNGVDDDCDGTADDGVTRYYPDYDGDSWGDAADPGSCTSGPGTVSRGGDCDELSTAVNPSATESCDGIDDDCDGLTDDADTVSGTPFYQDLDGDGFGDDASERIGCSAEADEVAVGGDCDDADADVNPDGIELYGDAIDENCDGVMWPTHTCSGYDVPGDYSSISSAITALASTGGTICLGAGTYSGPISYTGAGASISIEGIAPEETTISGSVTFYTEKDDSGLKLSNLTVSSVSASTPSGSAVSYPSLYLDHVYTGGVSVDMRAASYTSISIYRSKTSSISTQIECSWCGTSASKPKMYIEDNYILGQIKLTMGYTCSYYIEQNTIDASTYGIYTTTDTPYSYVYAYNNIITGASVAALYADEHWSSWYTGYNLLYDNTSNYAGVAAAGTGTVTSDPLLDYAYTPPVPATGSPAIGAASSGTSTDFWSTTRTTRTLGAVEHH